MPKLFTCGSPNRRTQFTYEGNVQNGVILKFDSGDIKVTSGFLNAAINQFRGKVISVYGVRS